MSGEERQDWGVVEDTSSPVCPSPQPEYAPASKQPASSNTAASAQSTASLDGNVPPPASSVDKRAHQELHPLVSLVKNPTTAVERLTALEVYDLYRTVEACLQAFLSSDHAAEEVVGTKTVHHACFLLQCTSFVSLHVLRQDGAGGLVDAHSTVELAKEMTERVLDVFEWAGRSSTPSVGLEALHALSVICVERNITQETILSAGDKVRAHKSIPLEGLLVSAEPSRPGRSSEVATSPELNLQLSRLIGALGPSGSTSSKSSTFAKQLPVSSWLQPHRGWQEKCRIHVAGTAAGPRRVTAVLCDLVERQPLATRHLEFAVEGMRVVHLLGFELEEMSWNLIRLIRHVAWAASHPQEDADDNDAAVSATKSSVASRLLMSALDVDGGPKEEGRTAKIHFRRNLEVLIVTHLFADGSSSAAPMLGARSELLGLAVSIMSKIINRVIADGIPEAEHKMLNAISLAKLAEACRQVPKEFVLGKDSGWECTTAYSALARFSIVMQVAGERILIRLLSSLASSHAELMDTSKGGLLLSGFWGAKSTAGRDATAVSIAPFEGPLQSPAGHARGRGKEDRVASSISQSLKKTFGSEKQDGVVSSVNPHIVKHRPGGSGKVREAEGNLRSIDRLLTESLFKFPASDMCGPFLVKKLTPAVFNALLDLLEIASVARPKSSATAASPNLAPRNMVRHLSFAIVDKGYLSEDRGRGVLEAAVQRWPLCMPLEVLALVARIAIHDASSSVQGDAAGGGQHRDSNLVLLLWNSLLGVFEATGNAGVVGVGGSVRAVESKETAVERVGPAASQDPKSEGRLGAEKKSISSSKRTVSSRPLRAASKPVLQIEYARVMVLLFATLTSKTKGSVLENVVRLFIRSVEMYKVSDKRGPPSSTLQALLALLHYMMHNFSSPCDSLMFSLEAFMLGEIMAVDERPSGRGDWGQDGGVASLEPLIRVSIDKPDQSAAVRAFDFLQLEVLNLAWNVAALDPEAVRILQRDGKILSQLLEACQKLQDHLFTLEMNNYRDKVLTACLLHAACRFDNQLQEAALSERVKGGEGMVRFAGIAHIQCQPTIKYLMGLRARFRCWVMDSGPKFILRQILEETEVITKSWTTDSGGQETCLVLVCLDALLNLQRLLLCGEEISARRASDRDEVPNPAVHMVHSDIQQLLEDLDAVMAVLHKCHMLLLTWWSTRGGSSTCPGSTSEIVDAAWAAGLPVEGNSTAPRTGPTNDLAGIRAATGAFCDAILGQRPITHDQSQVMWKDFLLWDTHVLASLMHSFGASGTPKHSAAGHSGSGKPSAIHRVGFWGDCELRSAVGTTCRLLQLMMALSSRLAFMRDVSSLDAGPAGRERSFVETCTDRLLVMVADVSTDQRLRFVHADSESCLRVLATSEDVQQQLLDLSNLRRIDSFLQAASGFSGSRPYVFERDDTRAPFILEHCIASVRELISDGKRSSALLIFYLDSSKKMTGSISTISGLIGPGWERAHSEGVQGKGNIALLLHIFMLSSDPNIIRDVLRLFRFILEKPPSAALARLKPFVRRNVAEILAVIGRTELRMLLGKLLLYRGMDSTASDAVSGSTSVATSMGSAVVSPTPAATLAAAGVEIQNSSSSDATVLRRSTLRFLTLVLDGVDESVDKFAGELLEVLLEFVPSLIRMPRLVLKECFAGIKFVCFRQSQACVERMIDVLLDALNKVANPATPPEAVANLTDVLAGLVASFQSVSRQPFSDLGSVTSAHVRASDTLSTVSTSSEVSNEGMSYTSRGESTVATSAVTYVSSTGHMDPDDSSAVGSHMDCASMDMDEDAASIDDDEEMIRESEGLLDEQEVSPEEEERRLASKVCSYTKTSNTFSEQHWYHCWTCGLTLQEGCCAVCAKVCHRGHDITYSRYSRFFCDCGAGKQSGHTCQALNPRNPDSAANAAGSSHGGEAGMRALQSTRSPEPTEATGAGVGEAQEDDVDISAWLADCEKLPGQLTRQARETLLQKLRGSHVSSILSNLYDCMVVNIEGRDGAAGQLVPRPIVLASLKTVHSREISKVHPCVQRRSLKAGSFTLSSASVPTRSPERVLAASRGLSSPAAPDVASANNLEADNRIAGVRSLLSTSTEGMLAVAEGANVEILDVRKKLLDATTPILNMDKTSIKLLSKTALPFEPVRVLFNPACPRHIAACGQQQCCVLSVGPSGKITTLVCLELSLQALGADKDVLDLFWLPNSEVCLAIVTDAVVNIYDLSADPICPIYSLRHASGERIRAATPYMDLFGMGVLVMLQGGRLFHFELDSDLNSHHGPCMLDQEVTTPEGMKGETGRALFYSLKSHLIVCVYGSACEDGVGVGAGRTVIARLAPNASRVTDWVILEAGADATAVAPTDSITAPPAAAAAAAQPCGNCSIDLFTDVGTGWGQLLVANSSTGVFGLVQVTIQAVRVLWLHSSLPGATDRAAVRACGMASSSWTRPALAGMMILLEDGSLQHWAIGEQHGLRQPDLLITSSSLEEDAKTQNKSGGVTFPVDFFEKGVSITNKVKFTGDITRAPAADNAGRKSNAAASGGGAAPTINEPMLSPNTDNLRIVIQNPNAEMCMIGVLVMVGDAMPHNIPTELHLHERLVETQPGVKRWYSLPLTNEEVLLSDKELVLTTLGSHFAGNPPAIDQIEVFAMRKDKFGWADKQRRAAQLAAAKERRVKSSQGKRLTVRGLDATEKAAISIMNALAVHWSVGGLQSLERECRTCRDKFLAELPKHLVLQRPVSTRPMLKRLLKVLFPSRDVYCEAKDQAQMRAIAALLHMPAVQDDPLLSSQIVSPSMLNTFTSLLSRVAARRPAHLSELLCEWPLLLKNLATCLWMVHKCCRFHCAAQLDPAAESVVNILHSYGMHLAQTAQAGNEAGANAGTSGGGAGDIGLGPSAKHDALMDHVLKGCLELLTHGVQHEDPRMRAVFGQRIAALVVGGNEPPVTEVHFDDGSQPHDHMDPHRLGPLFWEECVMPEQGLEKDGQASVVYCCDRCGQQPVVGLRWHCRVCKDFDLCDACYHSIADSAHDHPVSGFESGTKVLDLDSQRDDWLYPANVDPSDEETMIKLAVALSLEPEQARSPSVLFASSLLRGLCASLAGMMHKPCGAKCIPTMHLLLRLITNSSLRDDGTSMAFLVRSVSSALLAGGPLQPAWGAKRLQAPVVALLLLSQLISGPAEKHGGGFVGGGGRHAMVVSAERSASLRWAEHSSHVLHPDALYILSGSDIMEFLRLSLIAALESLEAPSEPSAIAGAGVTLLRRSSSLLSNNLDNLCGEDSEFGMGVGVWTDDTAKTPDSIALTTLDAVLRLIFCLHACHAFIARAGGTATTKTSARNQALSASAAASKGDTSSEVTMQEEGATGSDKAGVSGPVWDDLPALLCRCLGITRAAPARKMVRRQLRRLFSSRHEYDAVRDRAAFARAFEALKTFVDGGDNEIALLHKDSPVVTQAEAALMISKLVKKVCARVVNWQGYCCEQPQCLALILACVQDMPPETTESSLRLLSAAFTSAHSAGPREVSGVIGSSNMDLSGLKSGPLAQNKSKVGGGGTGSSAYKKGKSSRSADGLSDSSDESEDDVAEVRGGAGGAGGLNSRPNGIGGGNVGANMAPVLSLSTEAVDVVLQHPKLDEVVRHSLLECRAPKVRAEGCKLILGLWAHGSSAQKHTLLRKLLRMVPFLAENGNYCREFLDTLSILAAAPDGKGGRRKDTVSGEDSAEGRQEGDDGFEETLDEIAVAITRLIQREAALVAQHPNASLYQSLHRLVELEGYYLESQPCLICTPWAEVPLAAHKLDQLRAEAKFTDHTQIVKLVCSHSIQRFTVSITDVRRLKLVKTIHLYYNNKPVPDITQLKGKRQLWKRFAVLDFAADQLEASVDLAIPIVATNVMIEFAALHELPAAGLAQRMLCPRCNRPVTDRHGICRHCRENAFQCRLCRNINYENLDAFLCNECGYCKHARFEYTLVCKPSFSAEPILTEEDKAKAIEIMDRESENAHKAFEEIYMCKQKLEQLLVHSPSGSEAFEGAGGGGLEATSAISDVGPGGGVLAAATMASLGSAAQVLGLGHNVPHGLGGLVGASLAGAGLAGLAGLSTGPGAVGGGQLPPAPMMVNRQIQSAALVYCKDAKHAFHKMSNSVELLAAVRHQLTLFLSSSASSKSEDVAVAQSPAPLADTHAAGAAENRLPRVRPASAEAACSLKIKEATPANPQAPQSSSRSCFGCSSRLVMHALSLVECLARRPSCRQLIMREGLIKDLLGAIMHTGSAVSRRQARAVACLLVRDDAALTSMLLLQGVVAKVDMCLQHSRALDLDSALRDEMLLLMDACRQVDACWELKYKTLMQVLFKAVHAGADQTAVASGIILPVLEILMHICCSASPDHAASDKSEGMAASAAQAGGYATGGGMPLVTYAQWQGGAMSFAQWQSTAASPAQARASLLARKFGMRWLRRWRASNASREATSASGGISGACDLLSETWIRKLLLNRCSQAVRTRTKAVLMSVAGASPHRSLVLLDVLAGMLGLAPSEHGHSAELFDLISHLMAGESARLYLAARGFLPVLCGFITDEVARIRAHEASCSSDIAQGQVLKKLLQLLAALLQVPSICRRFKSTEGLLGDMLDKFLHVQSLIVQKTKLIDDCAQLLMSTFASISSESEDDKRRFCMACVAALEQHRQGRTSVFLLQQLCNIMCPVKQLPAYHLILTKSPTQEEFIRGAMTKNPYLSSDIGLVMRDVKRKICLDLDMAGLMDDENGMELLVRGQIISLDLPVHLVYEQVWYAAIQDASAPASSAAVVLERLRNGAGAEHIPMEVVYRLQGLDGEATEPLVDTLNDRADEDVDPEKDAAMTALMSETRGMAIVLQRVAEMDSLAARAELEPLLLELLHRCCFLPVNRRAALELGAVNVLLARISRALQQDPLPVSAEPMLGILVQLVEEANKQVETPVSPGAHALETNGGNRQEICDAPAAMTGDGVSGDVLGEQLASLLICVGAPAVREHPKIVQLIAHMLPFLTYGKDALMDMLIDHFLPHINVLLGSSNSQAAKEVETSASPGDAALAAKVAEEAAKEREAYVHCFVCVVQRIDNEATARQLRTRLTARGLVGSLSKVLADTLPAAETDKDSPLWAEALEAPLLPRVLQLLAGITRGYAPAQNEVARTGVLAAVHVLEDKSSEQQMGALAEELLVALAQGNERLLEEIEGLRQATLEKKRGMAQAQRERLLKEMGLAMGQDAAKAFSEQAKAMGWEEEDLSDEEGLVCVICHEGYRYKPEEVMGIYVFNRRCSIAQGIPAAPASSSTTHSSPAGAHAIASQGMAVFQAIVGGGAAGSPVTPPRGSASSRADRCVATVSNLSLVHMTCHAHATRAERHIKVPRLEWDGASLRNQNTKCNNLLPVRGPQTPAHMYSEHTERYWSNINQVCRHEGSRFRMVAHDVRLLLLRLASGASFAVDSGGGSAHSNIKLLPFLVQMGYQCLGDTSTSTWRQASSSLAKHLARSVPPTTAGAPGSGAGHGPAGAAGADGADFFAVATLWFPAKWRAHKGALLLAVVAQGLRAAHVAADAGGEGGAGVEEASMLAACRSGITLFALLARLHAILNKGSSSVAESAGAGVGGDGSNDSSSSSVEASRWAMEAEVAQEMIRGEHLALMESCDELVEFTQEELAVSESVAELLDAGELLQDLLPSAGDVDAFLQTALAAAASQQASPLAALGTPAAGSNASPGPGGGGAGMAVAADRPSSPLAVLGGGMQRGSA